MAETTKTALQSGEEGETRLELVASVGSVEVYAATLVEKASAKSNEEVLRDVKAPKTPEFAAAMGTGGKYIRWGVNDNLPYAYTEALFSNHIAPQLVLARRDLVLGQGLFWYRKQVENGKSSLLEVENAEGDAWMIQNQVRDMLFSAETNRQFCGNYFLYVKLGVNGGKISVQKVRSLDCHLVRLEKPDNLGNIANVYVCRDWTQQNTYKPYRVPLYDDSDPVEFAKTVKGGEFVIHVRDKMAGDLYYGRPHWYGALQPLMVANKFWEYHFSGLTNEYPVAYHLEIDWTAWEGSYSSDPDKDEEGKDIPMAVAKQKYVDNISHVLKGVDGKRLLVTGFTQSNAGTRESMVRLSVIERSMKDDMYLKIAERADVALASGFGLNPAIGGVDTGGKLGGSGSELRIAYQLELAMRCQRPRHLLLDPLNRVLKPILGETIWPKELKLGIEDVDITTIADNPTGREKVATPVAA